MKTIATIILALTISASAFAAPEIVKKADLPALKGGKAAGVTKDSSGIPTCFGGNRAKLTTKDMDAEPMLTWSGSHQRHACYGKDVVYVCRAGKNLSVRCE